jgi:thymidine kinase
MEEKFPLQWQDSPVAELIYYCGTMDSGKSTLALQTAHNHQSRGRTGLIFTSQDRAGSGVISSRLGLQSPAIEVSSDLDIHKFFVYKF